MMKSIRKVLIVQPYGIGDLLFLTPVLRAVRLLPSVEKVDLILGSRTEAVVQGNPHIDEVFVIDKDLWHRQSWSENFRFIKDLTQKLWREKYDLLLDYSQRSEYGFWAAVFLGIPRRAGFRSKRRGIFLNFPIPLKNGFSDFHVIDYDASVAERAGIPVVDRWMEYYVSDEDREQAKEFLQKKFPNFPIGKYAVVSPGGGESWGNDAHFKRWPVRFFAELLSRKILSDSTEVVFILGSAGEKALAEELRSLLKIPTFNLAGECSLAQTAALIEKSEFFLGNDGGLVHLAHALKVPVVALYGPVDPKVYGPYPLSSRAERAQRAQAIFKKDLECRPCYQNFRYKSDCVHRACLQELSVEEVTQNLSVSYKR